MLLLGVIREPYPTPSSHCPSYFAVPAGHAKQHWSPNSDSICCFVDAELLSACGGSIFPLGEGCVVHATTADDDLSEGSTVPSSAKATYSKHAECLINSEDEIFVLRCLLDSMNGPLSLQMLQESLPEIPTRREPSVASRTGMARLPSRYVPRILSYLLSSCKQSRRMFTLRPCRLKK